MYRSAVQLLKTAYVNKHLSHPIFVALFFFFPSKLVYCIAVMLLTLSWLGPSPSRVNNQ